MHTPQWRCTRKCSLNKRFATVTMDASSNENVQIGQSSEQVERSNKFDFFVRNRMQSNRSLKLLKIRAIKTNNNVKIVYFTYN